MFSLHCSASEYLPDFSSSVSWVAFSQISDWISSTGGRMILLDLISLKTEKAHD
jgi:hypothetical protein